MLEALTPGEALTYWGRWARGGGPQGYRSPLFGRPGLVMPLTSDELGRIESALDRAAPPGTPERALIRIYYTASGRPSIRRAADQLRNDYGVNWSPATVARRLAMCKSLLNQFLHEDDAGAPPTQ